MYYFPLSLAFEDTWNYPVFGYNESHLPRNSLCSRNKEKEKVIPRLVEH